MGLFSKDLFDARTGEKAGSASRLSSSYQTHTQNFFTDRKLIDKAGNHVTTQPSLVKENSGAILGIAAGIIGILGAVIGRED